MKQYRAVYVILRFIETIIQVFSRFTNATLLGGSTYQTISSRAYIESEEGSKGWMRTRKVINTIFFFQEEHCREAWEAEVFHAKKTLERLSIRKDSPNL
jgi:hypothetical protein